MGYILGKKPKNTNKPLKLYKEQVHEGSKIVGIPLNIGKILNIYGN